MADYAELADKAEKDFRTEISGLAEAVRGGDQEHVMEALRPALSVLSRKYYFQIAEVNARKNVRDEVKEKKIKELQDRFQKDIYGFLQTVREAINQK